MFKIIKKNYFLLISTFLILYFIFNLLDGERGLFSYMKKKELLKNLKQTEINYINKINNLEFKNSLLTTNLDLDYIEITISDPGDFSSTEVNFYLEKKKKALI